jgi:ferrochelatase
MGKLIRLHEKRGFKKMSDNKKTGVLLMTMGDPPTLGSIFPYLFRLFSDPLIIGAPGFVRYPLALYISLKKLPSIRARYKLIGGGSPMNAMTAKQAGLLAEALAAEGVDARVYVSNRYSSPSVADAYRRMKQDGIQKVIALPLYPHFSPAITGSSFDALKAEMAKDSNPPEAVWIRSMAADKRFAEAFSGKIAEAMEQFPVEERRTVQMVFSAHSLPHDFIKKGDPYLEEIRNGLTLILGMVRPGVFHLSFQSKGRPGMEWLKPETGEILQELGEKGRDKVLMVPISFVADNIETLYDNDIVYKNMAEKLGIKKYVRAACMNDDPAFISAMKDIVKEHI